MALYFAPRGLEGEWRALLIRHGSALGTVSYYVHTLILLRESCVIHTTVLVNSGDWRVYYSCRSRFRAPIYLAHVVLPAFSSRSPPCSLSLSLISAMAPLVCPHTDDVRTPTRCHIDLAGNTSYHFAASRTVLPRVSPYHGPGPFAPFWLTYMTVSLASI